MAEWPSGTVTFLFTDLEGSTKRWEQYPAAMGPALARHDRLLREAISAHGGVVFKTVGDAFCAAFATAPAAVSAALTAQRALHAETWGSTPPLRARMALHTGQAEVLEGDYLGGPLNRVARLLSLGYGGQVLLSGPTADLVHDYLPPGSRLEDLGTHRLKDVQRPEHVFQLVVPDLPWEFGPLHTSGSVPAAVSDAPLPEAGPAPPVEREVGRRPRTAVIAAVVAIALVAVIAGVLATQLGSGDDDPGPGPPPTANNPVDAAAVTATVGESAASAPTPTLAQIAEPTPSATVTRPVEPTPTGVAATEVAVVVAVASPGAAGSGDGAVVYMLNSSEPGAGRVYRIAAEAGAEPEDLSAALDALSPGGPESWVAASPDGAWLLFGTERFDPECVGWPCLVVAPADLSSAEVVRVDGAIVHTPGTGAITGESIVVPRDEGPHQLDLWAIPRAGDGWGTPVLLTADSPYAFHGEPAFSFDGTRVTFECGDRPYGEAGTAICEVGSDGTGFRVLVQPSDGPSAVPESTALRQPAYAPDGSAVFAATWDDRIWRISQEGGSPEPVGPTFALDSSPCVLADGRVVSLWDAPANSEGMHDLKVMTADGAAHAVLVTGVDVVYISCAG